MPTTTAAERSVADRIRQVSASITPAERKVVRALFSSAMLAGLDTVASLAARSKVSGPTVIRLTTKLGFDSYLDFQKALRGELEARSTSPLSLYHRSTASRPGDLVAQSRDVFAEALRRSFDRVSPAEFDAVVAALVDLRRPLFLAGGRFTQLVAQMLYLHLFQVRPNLQMLQPGLQSREDQLLDVGPRSVLMLFDFRRYQGDSVELARRAKARGATLLLMTDPWQSPIAEWADHVLIAEVASPSPYDSMVPAFALTEALVAEVVTRLGQGALKRIRNLETLRTGFEWEGAPAAGLRREKRRGRRP